MTEAVAPTGTVETRIDQFMNEPSRYFGMSLTALHSIGRSEREELEFECLRRRFEHHREAVPMLGKLAARQGIVQLNDVVDVVPLCFEHTAYKSYPSRLLQDGRFDQLTRWLNKLTPHDLSGVDATNVDSIDGWMDLLTEETPLDPITSSGTTGTMSFLPHDSDDGDRVVRSAKMGFLQDFGSEPGNTDDKVHVVWPTYGRGHTGMLRFGRLIGKYFTQGDKSHFHPLYDSQGSADIMYLAAQLRAAAARGDESKVTVSPALLARREEINQLQRAMTEQVGPFLENLVYTLEGERVVAVAMYLAVYDIARNGLAKGLKCGWASDSTIVLGGGAKGLVIPDDLEAVVEEFFGIVPRQSYGMSEQTHANMMCEHRRYHFEPGLIPIVLDPDDSKPLPRKGVQIGRLAFFDVTLTGTWGGVITGDEVEVDFEGECPCGRTTLHASSKIERYSEKRGGTDKISCAATPEAHAEAMEFLTSDF